MYRTAQDCLVASRQRQLRVEADAARMVARIHRPETSPETRVRHVLGLRLALVR